MQNLYTTDVVRNLTQIKRITIHITCQNTCSIMQEQFLVQIECAWTIHKAQGLTMEKLAFDPKEIQKHGIVYIALFHVKDIKFLYLLNKVEKKI